MALYEKTGVKWIRRADARFTNLEKKVAGLPNTTLEVIDLRVTFSIRKSDKGSSNTAMIQVYNMAPESRKFLEVKPTKTNIPMTVVDLEVGHGDRQVKIFLGRCTVRSEFKAPNWVTTLVATDGQTHYVKSYDKKFAKGTKIQSIVIHMLKKSGMALKKETINAISKESKLPRTRTFTGPPLMNIESLQKQYNFSLNIQDDIAILRSTAVKLAQSNAKNIVVVSFDNGLLKTPVRKGLLVYIKTIIFPEIKPGTVLILSGSGLEEFGGTYYVKRMNILGDTWGGPWHMDCQLIPVDEARIKLSGDAGVINA